MQLLALGYGGKVESGESLTKAARRELFEEACIVGKDLEKCGVVEFEGPNWEGEVWEVNYFRLGGFYGEPRETTEMSPRWFNIEDIPYGSMWDDDKYWMPLFLEGKKFAGNFKFDTKGKVIEKNLRVVNFK